MHAVSAVEECLEPSVVSSKSKAPLHTCPDPFSTPRSQSLLKEPRSFIQVLISSAENLTHLTTLGAWWSYDLIGTDDLELGKKKPFSLILKRKLAFLSEIKTIMALQSGVNSQIGYKSGRSPLVTPSAWSWFCIFPGHRDA